MLAQFIMALPNLCWLQFSTNFEEDARVISSSMECSLSNIYAEFIDCQKILSPKMLKHISVNLDKTFNEGNAFASLFKMVFRQT